MFAAGEESISELFIRHTPLVLSRHLIKKLLVGLGGGEKSSIERFHGSLLFVDISGFTVLSQRLSVDELRIQINSYFTKIIDIVSKYDGQVIKFAGDALFIIWQAKTTATEGTLEFENAIQIAVKSAIACGMEINENCSNYRISLAPKQVGDSFLTSALLTKSGPSETSESNGKANELETFLNVHSGVSLGIMAGMDVGCQDRWEYVLLGDALEDVAVAEGDAGKAEIVISPTAHTLAHGGGAKNSSANGVRIQSALYHSIVANLSTEEAVAAAMVTNELLPCGCLLTKNGYFKVNQIFVESAATTTTADATGVATNAAGNATAQVSLKNSDVIATARGGAARAEVSSEQEGNEIFALASYERVMQELVKGYRSLKPMLRQQYQLQLEASGGELGMEAAVIENIRDKLQLQQCHNTENATNIPNDVASDRLFASLLPWMQSCLLDDLCMHVHEADRHDYALKRLNREGFLKDMCMEHLRVLSPRPFPGANGERNTRNTSLTNKRASSKESPSAVEDEANNNSNSGSGGGGSGFVNKIRALSPRGNTGANTAKALTAKHHKKHEQILQQDGSLTAELRSVIVLFIRVELDATVRLLVSPSTEPIKSSSIACIPEFYFLERSAEELAADCQILSKFQSCMEIMTSSLNEHGGQLRQFIVDDKGTVCIGTFGLRGSVNNDNAASAVEAAHAIIRRMQLIGFNAGIGITSGRAYCGLVGSLKRHEYAVMGPSTNLAARLMGKATSGEVIVDGEIRKNDRTHQFIALAEIQAKGYSYLVPTFRPIFNTRLETANKPQLRAQESANSTGYNVLLAATTESVDITPSLSREKSRAVLRKLTTQQRLFPNLAPMHGRQRELRRIMSKLTPQITKIFENLSIIHDFLENPNDDAVDFERTLFRDAGVQFSVTDVCKVVCVSGANGMGKSTFATTFAQCLLILQQVDPALNMTLYRNKSSSVPSSEPFSAWKTTIKAILSSVHAVVPAEEKERAKAQNICEEETAVKHLFSTLPAESAALQHLIPLLSSVRLASKPINDNDITSKLSGNAKVTKICELFAAIVQQYVVLSGKVPIIVLDDIQAIDSASLQLLQLIFKQTKGVLILCSYQSITGSHKRNSTGGKGAASLTAPEVLAGFEKSDEQYEHVELLALDSNAVRETAQDIFLQHGIDDIDPLVPQKLFELSGGNPLYVYEIAKAMVDKIGQTEHVHLTKSAALRLIANDFRTSRIEEVIFYRFDQLDPGSQLLLKMASVACANGSSFSLSLLAFMIEDNSNTVINGRMGMFRQDTNGMMNLVVTVKDILNRNEFIKISSSSQQLSPRQGRFSSMDLGSFSSAVSSSPTHKAAANAGDISKETVPMVATEDDLLYDSDDWLYNVTFEFKIALEQSTIYNILLDDQKESLHDRIALFLENKYKHYTSVHGVTASERYEEGFHWERSKSWNCAMTCYYRSAMILDSIGAYQESLIHLTSAYRMLNAMRTEAGITENFVYAPASFAAIFTQLSTQPENCLLDETRKCKIVDLTTKDICRIFDNDSDLLETGLNVLLRLGQTSFTLSENPAITSRLYEEALQLILLTWKDRHVIGLGGAEEATGASAEDTTSAGSTSFGLKDPSICFPILAGIAALYRNRRFVDDAEHTKEGTMYRLMQVLAATSPEYEQHALVAKCFDRTLKFEKGEYLQSIQMTDEIRLTYSYDKHSSSLVKIYGNDRVPYTMAMNIQVLKLRGMITQSNDYLNYITTLLPNIAHLHSMAIVVLPLTAVMQMHGGKKRPYDLYSMYMGIEAARGGYSFFRETNPVIFKWFELEYRMERYTAERDASLLIDNEDCDYLLNIMNKVYMSASETNRPLLYEALNSFGLGVEVSAACICHLRAKLWILRDDVSMIEKCKKFRDNMRLAVEYIEFAVRCNETESRLIFGLIASLFIKAQILATILEKNNLVKEQLGEESGWAEEAGLRASAIAALDHCIEIGEKQDFAACLIYAGGYLETLGLDTMRGAEVQEKAFKRLIEINGTAVMRNYFENMVKEFSCFQRFEFLLI